VNVSYVEEDEPLGTAGALGLINEAWDDAFFVLNCDVLSDIDLVSMHRFHQLNQSQLTVAVKSHQVEVPFGVVEVDHERVVRLSEKPKLSFYVNAGIYLLEPAARDLIPRGRRYDVTDLILELLRRKATVCSFPIRSVWFDIGDHETLERVQALEL
jgi:NDP-sugar pyrophosphorylase family protein